MDPNKQSPVRRILRTEGDRPSIQKGGTSPHRIVSLRKASVCVDGRLTAAKTFWVCANSFSAPQPKNAVNWYVDGAGMMAQMAKDLRAAKRYIYFTDWALNANIRLIRDKNNINLNTSLRSILDKLDPKVQIRILLYDSMKAVLDLHDVETEIALELNRPNLRIQRQRDATGDGYKDLVLNEDNQWSHHQKTMIIDGEIAYLGGIDLYDGRWDNKDHAINPYDNAAFAGDHYNPCISDMNRQRLKTWPRMPWHDVHIRLQGPSVADVLKNFVERWNSDLPRYGEQRINPGKAPVRKTGSHQVQIVRSAAPKSIPGLSTVQANIQDAYINAIQGAQDFIYIENQYFQSRSLSPGCPTQNLVANALYERIAHAINRDEKFRVYVVVPVFPEGILDSSTSGASYATQEQMHWQYFSITTRSNKKGRSPGALLPRLDELAAKKNKKARDYIFFASLRGHGRIPEAPSRPPTRHCTEQIYVHSKLMIVDDRVVIVGSANINDRSLLGDRDTELSAIIVDEQTQSATINDRQTKVRKFARDLRMRLWREHLGIWKDDAKIGDPVSDKTYYDVWIDTAEKNTAAYEAVFPGIPSDRHTTIGEYEAAKAFEPNNVARLDEIRGHLVVYPLRFLDGEDLETYGLRDSGFTRKDEAPDSTGVG